MSGLVYSTEVGRVCPDCNQPKEKCVCKRQTEIKGDGNIRVSRQTKGRKGKGVTLVTGVALGGEELKLLGKKLKQKCGTGGTVKDGVIEIQGDHRDLLIDELKKLGYSAKKSGG